MNPTSRMVSYARIELEDIFRERRVVTHEELVEALEAARDNAERRLKIEISEEQIEAAERLLEGLFNVHVGSDSALVNNSGHEEWLDKKKRNISWEYWERYKRWLIEDELRSSSVIEESLEPVTDRLLGFLEDPDRAGSWSRRGLVAGQVQSGKTSNYVGLVNKAIDAGYKLIVILAGTHDNLRSQTQTRINEGVLGFNTQGNINGSQGQRVGVGLKDPRKPRINCPTSSAEKGDFNAKLAQGVGALGGDPVIFVVKKNTSILKNLHLWATGLHHDVDPESGRKIVRGVPLLVIDDEADNASIDTGSTRDKITGEESDPSATNKLIRQLLESFEKSGYVGYTATPFANIFINPSADHDTFGHDLFPEDFIVALPETSDYSGAARTFGLVEDLGAGIEAVDALPTTRTVSDYGDWLPDGHKKTQLPEKELPDSLREAILSFVLASAIKRYRRVRMRHNSMLVHVTRFIDVQTEVADQIRAFTDALRRGAIFSSANDLGSSAWGGLRALYDTDFLPTSAAMSIMSDIVSQTGEVPEFEALTESIEIVLEELTVECVNGEAKEALRYEQNREGVTVIAVGGDKLSRGLTLEGLTTSYYLRASRMYDTLMQMGRWFGYRPGYLDVCRLYTTKQLIGWYTRITLASESLYREFELMAAIGATPREFGLRVQALPDGLMVTAANKSRFAKNIRASFSGTVSETILFRSDAQARATNLAALRQLLAALRASPEARRVVDHPTYWRAVSPLDVLAFLDRYDGHRSSLRALPIAMVEYIRKCLALDSPELSSWDVFIASKSLSSTKTDGHTPTERFDLDDSLTIGLTVRAGEDRKDANGGTFVTKRLLSSGDEILPLTGDDSAAAAATDQARLNWEQSTRRSTNPPTGPTAVAERRVRDRDRGFLLIYPLDREVSGLDPDDDPYVGFGISFPWSEYPPSVNYRVNEIYWNLNMKQAFEDESDE